MIHLFYGEDEFSLREELAAIKSDLDADGMLVNNTSTLDGRSLKPGELLAVCATAPFLGGRRLVVVEGLLGRFESPRSAGSGAKTEDRGRASDRGRACRQALAELPETTMLVFVDGELSAANPLLRLLAPVAEAREFAPPRHRAVPDWIRDAGGQARPVDFAARRLPAGGAHRQRPADALAGAGEAGRLRAGPADRGGGREALVSSAREASVLAMVDAVVEGRTDAAVRLLEQLRGEGSSSSQMLSMITRQYRHLILAKELLLARLSPAEIGQRLGIRSEFALRKVLEQSRRYSMPQVGGGVRAPAADRRGDQAGHLRRGPGAGHASRRARRVGQRPSSTGAIPTLVVRAAIASRPSPMRKSTFPWISTLSALGVDRLHRLVRRLEADAGSLAVELLQGHLLLPLQPGGHHVAVVRALACCMITRSPSSTSASIIDLPLTRRA